MIPCQMAKIIGSMLIRHRPHVIVSDRYLIDVDPKVFAIWACMYQWRAIYMVPIVTILEKIGFLSFG